MELQEGFDLPSILKKVFPATEVCALDWRKATVGIVEYSVDFGVVSYMGGSRRVEVKSISMSARKIHREIRRTVRFPDGKMPEDLIEKLKLKHKSLLKALHEAERKYREERKILVDKAERMEANKAMAERVCKTVGVYPAAVAVDYRSFKVRLPVDEELLEHILREIGIWEGL